MEERLATLLADLERAESLAGADLHRAARRASWVAEFNVTQFAEMLTAIAQLPMPLSSAADRLLANWLVMAVQARLKAIESRRDSAADNTVVIAAIESRYRNLQSASRARGQLLAWLATGGSAAELALFGGFLLEGPRRRIRMSCRRSRRCFKNTARKPLYCSRGY